MQTALISFRIYLKFPKKVLQFLQHPFPKVSLKFEHKQPAFDWRDLLDSCDFPASHTLDSDILVCGVLSTYAGSWEEGMSYRVRIARLNLWPGTAQPVCGVNPAPWKSNTKKFIAEENFLSYKISTKILRWKGNIKNLMSEKIFWIGKVI